MIIQNRFKTGPKTDSKLDPKNNSKKMSKKAVQNPRVKYLWKVEHNQKDQKIKIKSIRSEKQKTSIK